MATLATSFRSDGQCPCSTIFADRVTTRHEPNGKWPPFDRMSVELVWSGRRRDTLSKISRTTSWATRVLWQVVDGPKEWIGTKVSFGPQTGGRLHHSPLQTPGLEGAGGVHAPLQHQVGSLFPQPQVSFSRPGKGAPEPNDTKIDNWN